MKRIYALFFLLLFAIPVWSQDGSGGRIAVRGRVLDAEGLPVIGANIVEAGDLSNGTISDADGNFVLDVARDAFLEITYLGFTDLRIAVDGKTSLAVVMEENARYLDEVVVTALGIKREEKALGYAVQKVGGETLQRVPGIDVGTSLTGKVSGLLVQNSTEFNAVPSIYIRGEAPLLVVDGVAYANKFLQDISSEDIESMSVLKGATASALYGFRGASGAILVTTKNGSSGKTGMSVDMTTNTMFSAGYLAIPAKQAVYGRGTDNLYDKNSTSSWGTVMDGKIVNQWDPFKMAYADSAYLPVGKDNFKNFLEQGYITNNNVNVAFKGKDIALRSSLNWTENKGRYPNQKLDKYSFTLGGDINLGRFQFGSNMSYARRHTPNMGFNGYTSYDPMYALLVWSPADFDILDYRDNYWMIEGEKQNYTYQKEINNPYFDAYEKTRSRTRDIFNADLTTSYQIAPRLKATLRGGVDFYMETGRIRVSKGSYVSTGNSGVPGNLYPWNGTLTGAYLTGRNQGISLNGDFLLTGDKRFGKFRMDYLAGGTIYYKTDNNINAQTDGGIIVADFFSLNASVKPAKVGESMSAQQVNSLYGRLSLSWNNFLYLEATGRNDWSSTLAAAGIDKADMSYFYPSVSGSFVVSELFPESTRGWLDLLKVRSSWTLSKTPAAIYDLNQAFTIAAGTWNNLNAATAPHKIYPTTVRPNASRTTEFGLQGIFFKNRLGLDVSWYDKKMYDNLEAADISAASGMSSKYVNTDEIINRRGWEVSLSGTPVDTRGWTWSIAANWSAYRRTYTRLDETYSSKKPWVKVGNRVDAYTTNDYLRVPETGAFILTNGRVTKSKYPAVVGYADPDWLWGINTTLRWKNLTFFASFDGIVGGMMSTQTENLMWRTGGHPDSLTPERAADVADPGSKNFLAPGVKIVEGEVTYDTDGNITSDTRKYAANDVNTTYKQYIMDMHTDFAWGGSAPRADIYSKTYLKLREVSLTYSFPKVLLSRQRVLKGASVSFVGQNVLLWAEDFKYSDPDGGYENLSDPSVRYLGFNIKLNF